MNALAPLNKFAMASDDGIFAPVSPDLLGALLSSYDKSRADIAHVSAVATGDQFASVMGYFASGNCGSDGPSFSNARALFAEKGAVAALNSSYWSKALKLTDVYDLMPQKRRDEWDKQIKKHEAPEFTPDTVIPTIIDLLNMRPQFLAERVDGLFSALSHEHVTNCPQGFGKRMIMYVFDSFGSSSYKQLGHLTDLRKIIAKFMGRDEPKIWQDCEPIIKAGLRDSGSWISIDGGAMRIRVYKKGTAHLEIHPEMVWRLNAILAYLYPAAIPAEFRTKPKRKAKEVELTQNLLPFAVVNRLQAMKSASRRVQDGHRDRYVPIKNGFKFDYCYQVDKHVQQKAEDVLKAIGGVWSKDDHCWLFDYDALPLIHEICAAGCIPDHKSHQFYPTPESVARDAIKLAEIGSHDVCLEPSAGQGGLADLMPKERTCCIEVSKLHCGILKAKNHNVTEADFLQWNTIGKFDRVVMNPPYSEGRWKAHTEHAASMLRNNGILVAILPASAANSFELKGFDCSWSGVYANEFEGTGVSVRILKAVRL